MVTEYVWINDPCEHCGRGDRVHVGTEATGWPFTFHGYHDHSVLGPLESRLDWRKVFTEGSGKLIAADCKCEIEDPVAWIDKVVPEGKSLFAGTNPEQRGHIVGPDPEGYRISFHKSW